MSSVPPTKVCTKCKVEKPAEEFHVKDKKTGRRFSWCKACHNAGQSARYHAGGAAEKKRRAEEARRRRSENPARHRETVRRFRERHPERAKEQAQRSEAKRKDKKAAYRARVRERRIAYNREYRERNAERVKAGNAEYREKNRDALKERQRRWRERNPERYYLIHAGWKRRNPDKVKAAQHRRRLREAAAGTYTPAEWQAVKARHDCRCVMCGRHESEAPLCVDHVVPLSRGGRNTADNLQPLCRSCNSKKHARLWDYRWRRGERSWPRRNSLRRS